MIVLVLFIYVNSDRVAYTNNCERQALKVIADSKDSVVKLDLDCSVLAWSKITKPEDSELNAQLMTIWKITKEKKLYYNK
jgi:hypothetical protein